MPIFRRFSSLFGLAAAVLLASLAAAPSQARVALGAFYPSAWGYYAALPYSYTLPYAIAFPGYAYSSRWLIVDGLSGATGRLHLP
ncbi:MAG TPA: hypothetical protein VE993_05340 [Stellaceae bacterium]|nr:hypothetical protein [Stellaceae bacterium]